MMTKQNVWIDGVVASWGRTHDVVARLDAPSDDDDEYAQASGAVQSADELPVGQAMSLQLVDGSRALIVIVDEHGRFLASNGVWRS